MGVMNAGQSVGVQWALVGISLTFLLVRFYVRGWVQSSLAISDALVLLAWIFSALGTMTSTFIWRWGVWKAGLNIWVGRAAPNFSIALPDPGSQVRVMQLLFVGPIMESAVLYCVKGSLLLFYLPLFEKKQLKLRMCLYFSIVSTIFGFFTSLGLNLFWCLPIERNWSLTQSSVCLSSFALTPYIITTTFHIASDVMVYSLPILLVKDLVKLQLSKRQLTGLGFVVSLGWASIICACLKTINLTHARSNNRLISVCLWDAIEQALAIIVVCCPPLKFLWHTRKGKRSSASSMLQQAGVFEPSSLEAGFNSRANSVKDTSLGLGSYKEVFELIVIPRPPDRSLVRPARGNFTYPRLPVRSALNVHERSELGVLPVFIDTEHEQL